MNQREFVLLDPSLDKLDSFEKETRVAESEPIEWDPKTHHLLFQVNKELEDQTHLQERYSFLPFHASSSYQQREYSRELQNRFGYFKRTIYKLDKFGRMTTSERKEFMDRWDTSRPIVYYL